MSPFEVRVLYTGLVDRNTLYSGGLFDSREPFHGHWIVRHQNGGNQSNNACQDAKHNEHDSP
jgi:hypothetical protein